MPAWGLGWTLQASLAQSPDPTRKVRGSWSPTADSYPSSCVPCRGLSSQKQPCFILRTVSVRTLIPHFPEEEAGPEQVGLCVRGQAAGKGQSQSGWSLPTKPVLTQNLPGPNTIRPMFPEH